MAHKKGVGSSDNGRDSKPKYLGVKLFGGQYAKPGNILIRQRGTKYHAGENTYMGKDHTIHAAVHGTVVFSKRRLNRTFVSIMPLMDENTVVVEPPVEEVVDVVATTPVTEEAAETVTETNDTPEEVVTEENTSTDTAEADDLRKIEGIGPKIAEILGDKGIATFQKLSETSADDIRAILEEVGGARYKRFDPTTWPEQAKLAANGEWDKLKEWQDELTGGK